MKKMQHNHFYLNSQINSNISDISSQNTSPWQLDWAQLILLYLILVLRSSLMETFHVSHQENIDVVQNHWGVSSKMSPRWRRRGADWANVAQNTWTWQWRTETTLADVCWSVVTLLCSTTDWRNMSASLSFLLSTSRVMTSPPLRLFNHFFFLHRRQEVKQWRSLVSFNTSSSA